MINTTAKLEKEEISKRQEVYFNEMKERMKKQSQGLLELKTAISVLEPIKKELRYLKQFLYPLQRTWSKLSNCGIRDFV